MYDTMIKNSQKCQKFDFSIPNGGVYFGDFQVDDI